MPNLNPSNNKTMDTKYEDIGSIDRVSPSRVLPNIVDSNSFRPGSPSESKNTYLCNDDADALVQQGQLQQFFRPGSPLLYSQQYHHSYQENYEIEDQVMEDINLPQDIANHHTLINDPLFTVIE